MNATAKEMRTLRAGVSDYTVEQLLSNGSVGRLIDVTAKRWPSHDRAAIEDIVYKQLAVAYTDCRADEPGGLYNWLRTSVHGRMCDLHKIERGRDQVLRRVAAESRDDFCDSPDVELTRAANAELVGDLLFALSQRDRRIVRLAWGEGERRCRIAASLGVSERLVKKALERARKKLQARLVDNLGGGCGEPGELLVRAQAFHLTAGEREREEAIAHIEGCHACAALCGKLEQVLAAAALAPAPMVADPSLVERAADRLSGVAVWGREQLTSVHSRAFELSAAPPPIRPGAVLASLGVCVVAAGGSYCVDQVVPSLGVLGQPRHERTEPAKPPEQTPAAETSPGPSAPEPRSAPPAVTPPTAPKPAAEPTPQPAPPPSQAAPSAPARERDFEFERSRPAVPRTPAAAPTQGGGEFF